MANIFADIAQHHDLVNKLADEYASKNLTSNSSLASSENNSENQFTQVFKWLFPPKPWTFGENMNSWLDAIATNFSSKEIEPNPEDKIVQLFTTVNPSLSKKFLNEDNTQVSDPKIRKVGYFYMHLFSIYPKLRCIEERPDFHNIFRFMGEFKIDDTRVVIMGQDPAPKYESSGFAYHKTICGSTINLIKYANYDLHMADHFNNSKPSLAIEEKQIEGIVRGCSLQGWIDQRVLMLNASLTIGNEKAKAEGSCHTKEWKPIVNCLLKWLDEHGQNIVFIFTGNVAQAFEKMITKTEQHLVISVSHPGNKSHYNPSGSTERNWEFCIPLLTANFFLYKKEKEIIDWTSVAILDIDGKRTDIDGRKLKYRQVFEEMISNAFDINLAKKGYFRRPKVYLKKYNNEFTGFCNSIYDEEWETWPELHNSLNSLSLDNEDAEILNDNTDEPRLLVVANSKEFSPDGRMAILKALVDKRANCNVKSQRGGTLLHVGVLQRDQQIVNLAIEKGVNPRLVRGDNLTPLQLAKEMQSLLPKSEPSDIKDIIEVLTGYENEQMLNTGDNEVVPVPSKTTELSPSSSKS